MYETVLFGAQLLATLVVSEGEKIKEEDEASLGIFRKQKIV